MGLSSSKTNLIECLEAIQNEEISLEDQELWNDIFLCGITKPEDLFEVVGTEAVRTLRMERWEALQLLIQHSSAKICEFLEYQESAETPLREEMLIALRIVTRIWPALLSDPEDATVHDYLWEKRPTSELMPFLDAAEDEEYSKASYCIATMLLQAALHLCFFPEFGADSVITFGEEALPTPGHKYNIQEATLCWAPGIAVTEEMIEETNEFNANRIEVMRALIAFLSGDLFQAPTELDTNFNRYLQVICSEDLPFTPELFYSLVNVVMKYDPVGWAIPFGATLEGQAPSLQVETALQLLLILLNYGDQYKGQPKYNMNGEVQPGFNTFRCHLARLSSPEEFDVILDGTLRLLNSQPAFQSTYMPGAITQINCITELLIFFYRALTEADDFHIYVLKNPAKTLDMVLLAAYIIQHALEAAQQQDAENTEKDAAVGTMRVCVLILQRLSENRQFGLSLRAPYTPSTTVALNLASNPSNFADVLILSFHKIFVSPNSKLEPLYNSMTTTLYNVSPFLNSICKGSCMKLLNLIECFSSLKFAMKSQERMNTLLGLLKVVDNLIMYQYQGNKCLVYALMQRKPVFEKLKTLSSEVDSLVHTQSPLPPPPPVEKKFSKDLKKKLFQLSASAVDDKKTRSTVSTSDESWDQVESGRTTPKRNLVVPEPSEPVSTVEIAKEFTKKIKISPDLKHISDLLEHLEPQVAALAEGEDTLVKEDDVILFLEDTSMIGVLPPPSEFHATVGVGDDKDINQWIRIFTWQVVSQGTNGAILFDTEEIFAAVQLF